jgi:hypothetical protein
MVAGAATGAAIGAVAAGPLGVFVGGTLGAVAGALGGAAAGAAVDPEVPHRADVAPASSARFQTQDRIETPPAGGLNTENLDTLGKDFGAFYPRGHMVVAFQTRGHLAQLTAGLKDLGRVTTDHLEVTSQRMIEFAERNIQEAGVIATMGTSVTTLRGFLEAAKNDAVFLVVPTPDDASAEQVTTVLRGVPYLIAERYRDLAIESVG